MHCGAYGMTLYIEPHTAVCFMLTGPGQGRRVGQACCCSPLWWAAVLCWLVTCGAMRNKLWFNCCWPNTRSLSRITEVRRLITTSSTHSREQGSDSFVAHFLSYCHIIFSVTRCPPIYILCILIYIYIYVYDILDHCTLHTACHTMQAWRIYDLHMYVSQGLGHAHRHWSKIEAAHKDTPTQRGQQQHH